MFCQNIPAVFRTSQGSVYYVDPNNVLRCKFDGDITFNLEHGKPKLNIAGASSPWNQNRNMFYIPPFSDRSGNYSHLMTRFVDSIADQSIDDNNLSSITSNTIYISQQDPVHYSLHTHEGVFPLSLYPQVNWIPFDLNISHDGKATEGTDFHTGHKIVQMYSPDFLTRRYR